MTEQRRHFYSLPASFWLAAALLWLVMFSLASLSPFMTDNYLFSKNMTPGYAQFMAGAPIESLEPMTLDAAFEQSVRMYKTWCGRFLGNFFVYASFLLPDGLRQALSAMVFVALCVLIHVHIHGLAWKEKLTASSLLFIAACLWLGMPSFGSAFFWVSVGGLPAIVFQLLFLLPYRFCLEKGHLAAWSGSAFGLGCILMLLLGMCCASLDYASSAAMPMAALAGVILYLRREREKRTLAFLLCGFLGVSVGSALTLLAPGNAGRMALTTETEVHAWLASSLADRIMAYACHLPGALLMQWLALAILFWACWVFWRAYGGSFWRRLPLLTVFFLVPFAATHAAYFFTPWPPARAFATTYVQLFIAGAIAASYAKTEALAQGGAPRRVRSIALFLLSAISLATLYQDAWKFYSVHSVMQKRDAVYAAHPGEDVRVAALAVQGDSRMVLGYQLQDLDRDPNFWLNRAVAKYWGLKSVAIEDEAQRRFRLDTQDAWGNDCVVEMSTEKGRVLVDLAVASQKEPAFSELYIYYYGKPAAIYLLPQPLNNAAAESLGADFMLPKLVPLFFARATAPLRWRQEAYGMYRATGSAKLWGHCLGTFPFWLVRPGEDALSLSVHFFRETEQARP